MWNRQLLPACFAALSIAAAAQGAGRMAPVEHELGSDHFASGCPLRIHDAVKGDLLAASCNLAVGAAVGGSAVVAGGSVDLEQEVGGDVYAAGGRVMVNGPVGRNARMAGGHVELGPKGSIAGNASIAGGEVTVTGPVKGYLQAAGGRVTLDAPVDGDVSVGAAHLTLGPNARIGGKLRYRGEELLRNPAAQVNGGVEQAPRSGERHSMRYARRGAGWIWTAGLVLLAAIIAGALPGASQRMAQELRAHPWRALLHGFIALVCIPAAALVLMVTIIGIPVGLLAILVYLALLLVGYAGTAAVAARAALERFQPQAAARASWRVATAMLVMLAIALAARIPFVGGFVGLVVVTTGLGLLASLVLQPSPAAPA